MGVKDSRKGPPLPAPTETNSTEGGSIVDSKTETYSVPEDGSPITLSTRRKKAKDGPSESSHNRSQTSFLIDFFEGGKSHKEDQRKPSVRVKVTPSSKSRSRSAHDHIQITEKKGNRKPSYTKRIQLSPKPSREGDEFSTSSVRSAAEESNVTDRSGVEVEIMRHGSPLIPDNGYTAKYMQAQAASDISSLPADSFLDGKSASPERKQRSRSMTTGEAAATGAAAGLVASEMSDRLKTPSRRRSRSLSRERILAQKATEKVRGEREKSERRRKHRSRSRSVSAEQMSEGIKTPRRRSSRSHHDESVMSGPESVFKSQLSNKSGDQQSFRSSTSKSSINNPKLLETVEDAIRRLILPELSHLRREQSKHTHRERDRRGSMTSGSGISREEETKSRRSSGRGSVSEAPGHPKVTVNDEELISSASPRPRKDKKLRRVVQEGSPKSFERDGSEETVTQEERLVKKRSSGRHGALENAAANAAVTALTADALHEHRSQESLEEKKRRRRRNKSRSRSGNNLAETYEEHEEEEIPPMPLMSDVNASDITRSSILSAETERPNSASQEHRMTPTREVRKGVVSPASRTPTRTPIALQQGLGTQHSNVSRGNLSLHSQTSEPHLHRHEYELDEHGRKVPMHESSSEHDEELYVEEDHEVSPIENAVEASVVNGMGSTALNHDDVEEHGEHEYNIHNGYYGNTQVVPPPLRYVPYAQERRGLSPIQSVSGYTEGEPETQNRESRLTHSTGSYSSLAQSARHINSARSMKSLDSLGEVHNHHDFKDVRQGGLTDSELTQDGEYWDEQHKENDRNRDLDAVSFHSSDPRIDYKRMTNYTDDSVDVGAGQNVATVAQNPNFVHTPIAVESAVASLINESELTGSSAKQGQDERRGSYASFEEGSERQFSSRGTSPVKREVVTTQQNGSGEYPGEYELDENGRKITMPKYEKSATTKKGGIAGIVSGAAAAVLGRGHKKIRYEPAPIEERRESVEAPQHKSFKQRAMEGQGPISPRHSVDKLSDIASQEQLKMTASGIPDAQHPMPEIGYGGDSGGSDVTTNPSIIQGPIGGTQHGNRDHWPGQPTPNIGTTTGTRDQKENVALKAAEAALVGAAASAGEAAAVSGHRRHVSRDHEDEWQRTSAERKRDTLVTNPYEGTSPIAALGPGLDNDVLAQPPFHHGIQGFDASRLAYPGSPGGLPKDEGYISSANNAGAHTPEPRTHERKLGGNLTSNDPFYDNFDARHGRHVSGMSHGMASPMYDAATGHGMDRIQSKDIVALMDHLTVRDAQRSARDTEILVTLVRAAAEMRNSFEDMKRLLADTEDVIITEVQQNTDKSVQKAINGPRPQPQSAARSLRQGSHDEMYDDLPAKKRNVFRKALKGLSMRSSNDLGKIEDMLVQLLGDVEGLKSGQGLGNMPAQQGMSYDDLQPEGRSEQDRGYEPEGNAGTSTASHASQSGHFSLPRSQGGNGSRGFEGRKFSDHRISTVPEGDEDDLGPHEQAVLDNQFEHNEDLLTPTRETIRGGSAPLETPPQQYIAPASLSNENTPTTDKSKKGKSGGSMGWLPKVKRWSGNSNSTPKVSRWSETTASTVLKGFRSSGRSSGRKGDDAFADPPSQSGSDLGEFTEPNVHPSGEDKLHSGFSQENFQDHPETLAAMSLLPPEDPKYKAHRNSLNLQHPQPRPGPQVRYQTALETQAQDYMNSPRSPKSIDWGSNISLNRLPQHHHRYSDGTAQTGNQSPLSEGGYSNASAADQGQTAAPPRPPKVPEIPAKVKPNKLQKPSPLSNEHLSSDDGRYGSETGGSPRSAARILSGNLMTVPKRKPTGPRSMSSANRSGELVGRGSPGLGQSGGEEEGPLRRNANRDTFGTIGTDRSVEDETF